MRILFCRSNAPIAVLIRWMTWSKWSHVALTMDDGWEYEATSRGVVKETIESLLSRYDRVDTLWVPTQHQDKIVAFLNAQLGKPYDFSALFGFIFRRDWAEDDKWFCSELVAAALHEGGIEIVCKPTNRITPQDLYESTALRAFVTL